MPRDYKELEAEVLQLDLDARAELAHALLLSLEDLSEEENERLWGEEAERRQRELREGRAEAIPGEEALRQLRAAIS